MNFEEIIYQGINKTVYRDGDKTIKVFGENFTKAEVLNEALNQARIENCNINIPKILEITKIDGKWAIVREYIKGTTLKELMEKYPKKLDEYLELFVDLQMKVHAERCPMLTKLKDKMNLKISQADLDDNLRFELHARLEGMPKHNKVCHGDFNPSNVIIAEDGTPYVIDWSHVTQGNASADVARTYLLFSLQDNAELADKYMEMFCGKSNTEKKYVQKWLPIVAASQSVKGNPEEKEFLQKWFSVVEYH